MQHMFNTDFQESPKEASALLYKKDRLLGIKICTWQVVLMHIFIAKLKYVRMTQEI